MEFRLLKITLPLIPLSARFAALLGAAIGFVVVYSLLGFFPLATPITLPLTFVDRAVPLVPATAIIYASDYVFVLLVLLSLKSDEAFSLTFFRMIAASLLSFGVFMLLPTVYPRPAVPAEPFWSTAYAILHRLDQPTNCFPSLHVSITLLAAVALRTAGKRIRWGAYVWAFAICGSTLTTKQHYFLDILGGIFVCLMGVALTPLINWKRKTRPVRERVRE